MFALPVSKELLGGSEAAMWILVILAGGCMTASAYFGIESLTVISYIAVPLVGILGTVAMVMAVSRGDGTIIDQFAVSSGSLTVVGGAGLVIGSFVSGGTATPNFTRFAKDAKTGTVATVVAFFLGNSLMFFFGAIAYIFVGGNDIFEVMLRLGLFQLAVVVLGLNIWTTNDNALYSAGLGPCKHLPPEEKTDGARLRNYRNRAFRMALQQLLRLAEHPELYASAGRHHPCDVLLYEPGSL